jgi:hypothetical protein
LLADKDIMMNFRYVLLAVDGVDIEGKNLGDITNMLKRSSIILIETVSKQELQYGKEDERFTFFFIEKNPLILDNNPYFVLPFLLICNAVRKRIHS